MTADDECEEWVGWIIPVDPEIDARVEAMARKSLARLRADFAAAQAPRTADDLAGLGSEPGPLPRRLAREEIDQSIADAMERELK